MSVKMRRQKKNSKLENKNPEKELNESSNLLDKEFKTMIMLIKLKRIQELSENLNKGTEYKKYYNWNEKYTRLDKEQIKQQIR